MTENRVEPNAAVAIVCSRRPEESILFMRRSKREGDSWSGQWSFPGGRRHPSDADLLHTALRELQEECGIRLSRDNLEQELPPVIAGRGKGPFLPVAPFVFKVDDQLSTILEPREAVQAVWVPRGLLVDSSRHSLRSVPGQPPERRFPAFDLNGFPLWGFTYRVITDWLGVAPSAESRRQVAFQKACSVLDFLLSQGLKLTCGWSDGSAELATPEHHLAKVARIAGTIPVDLLFQRFSGNGSDVACLLFLEVRPDCVRLTGLDFEQYLILASNGA